MTSLDPEFRRLRSMQREVGFILGANILAIASRHSSVVLVVLGINLLFWALMFQQIRRDLRAAAPLATKPTNRGDRMGT